MNEILLEITCEAFYQDLLEILERHSINKVVCLGLGHFSECPIARVQLALLTGLTKSVASVIVQDPAFYLPEKEFLRSLGYHVQEENLEGKFKTEIGERILYFLPHCPKSLTNNLLWRNWSEEELKSSILVCNSFQGLLVTTLEKDIPREAAFVRRIAEFTTERPLKACEKFFDSFNDTSIHLFESENLQTIPNSTDFWQDNEEPESLLPKDLELISEQIKKL